MMSVMTCGWLMARSHAAALAMLDDPAADHAFARQKLATSRYYLDVVTAEATGLGVAATAGAAMLYDFAVTT
jgi:hypothetical protein